MPCEHMGVLLSRYVDGEASAEDRRVVEGHVRECEDCRQELEVFTRNEALLGKAFSEEVAGEAFIADVLAKAGLVPSRPGPIRQRLNRVAGTIAAFLSVPARAVATVLVGLSGLLAWNSYTVHQQNKGLIDDINIALRQMQESNVEKRELVDLIDKMKSAIVRAMAQPEATPPKQVVVEGPSDPDHALSEAPVEPALPPEPEKFVPGLPNDFFHFVSAVSWEEGVYLSWETRPPEDKVKFNVRRKEGAAAEFAGAINGSPVLTLCYLDTTATPVSSYTYEVVAVHENGREEHSRAIEVRTLGDIVIQNNGVMSFDNETTVRSIIEVRRYVDGRWVSATFPVGQGQAIGGRRYCKETQGEVDFTTGCTLQRIEEEEREVRRPRRELQLDGEGKPVRDPRTKSLFYLWREITEKVTTNRIGVGDKGGKEYKLWKGEGRRGTLGSLE